MLFAMRRFVKLGEGGGGGLIMVDDNKRHHHYVHKHGLDKTHLCL